MEIDLRQVEQDLFKALDIIEQSGVHSDSACLLRDELRLVMTAFRLDLAETLAAKGAFVEAPMWEHLVSLKKEIEALIVRWMRDTR